MPETIESLSDAVDKLGGVVEDGLTGLQTQMHDLAGVVGELAKIHPLEATKRAAGQVKDATETVGGATAEGVEGAAKIAEVPLSAIEDVTEGTQSVLHKRRGLRGRR